MMLKLNFLGPMAMAASELDELVKRTVDGFNSHPPPPRASVSASEDGSFAEQVRKAVKQHPQSKESQQKRVEQDRKRYHPQPQDKPSD